MALACTLNLLRFPWKQCVLCGLLFVFLNANVQDQIQWKQLSRITRAVLEQTPMLLPDLRPGDSLYYTNKSHI